MCVLISLLSYFWTTDYQFNWSMILQKGILPSVQDVEGSANAGIGKHSSQSRASKNIQTRLKNVKIHKYWAETEALLTESPYYIRICFCQKYVKDKNQNGQNPAKEDQTASRNPQNTLETSHNSPHYFQQNPSRDTLIVISYFQDYPFDTWCLHPSNPFIKHSQN